MHHPLLLLPTPLHGLIRSYLGTRDALAVAAASSCLLELHRLWSRSLTLRAWASPPLPAAALHALASLLARQQTSVLRQLRVRIVVEAAAAVPAVAHAADGNSIPPNAWPAAAGPPTGAGDLMTLACDEELDADNPNNDDNDSPVTAPTPSLPMPQLPPLPCLPQVERVMLEAAEDEYNDDGYDRAFNEDNTMHASLAAVLVARNMAAELAAGSSARASMTGALLRSLLAPGVLMSLRVLILEGRDLLDERGFAILGQALEARQRTQPRPSHLTTLALEPPSEGQSRGLARILLSSGACNGLEELTLRRINAPGMAVVARYLLSTEHSGRLRSLALFRREGHLAWADPVAEALAAHGAPSLQSLHLSFLPFSTEGAEALSAAVRLRVQPLRALRLTAAGLGERELAHLLLPTPHVAPSRELRVLRLDFRGAVARVLPQALLDGACPQLQVLGLVHCRVGDAGCAALAQALAFSTPHLRSLDLAFNDVGSEGADAVARWCLGVSGCGRLEELRLDGNPLTDGGVMRLAQALKPNGLAAAAAMSAVAAGALCCIPDTETSSTVALLSVPAPKLRTLELRRVEMGPEAVHALCGALLHGAAPALERLFLGTPSTPGMAPGDGSHGYVEAGALDASLKAMMRAARPELYVRQEAGSPLMGLV